MHIIKKIAGKSTEKNVFIKYFFSIIVACVAAYRNSFYYGLFILLEIGLIFCVTNRISNKIFQYVSNCILIFFVNVQSVVLIYGRSYLTLVMIQNLESVEDLSGRAVLYIGSAMAVIIITFLPIKKIELKKISYESFTISLLVAELICSMVLGNKYSPFYGYLDLGFQAKEQQIMKMQANEMKVSAQEFFSADIANYIEKPKELVENPNIILIFTEGLSQNVINDERKIMPNVERYQAQALKFTQYYNHTFATYRGLIGQLYSGYQLDNYDSNKLISLQDIFSAQGYSTTFINTEPNNPAFTAYLKNFKFDFLDSSINEPLEGMAQSISDRQAYEKLFSVMEERNKENKPFLISMYTLGTHVSFDSTDKVFGDGKNAELNKFYNVDYYFGQFMEKFENSSMADNTIIIFTTDHCTYLDDAYRSTFPNVVRDSWETDEIPLFIYYSGMESTTIDARGRNSLDLAPTICDYLDISTDNYFLGVSLFSESGNNNYYDTTFNQSQDYLSTRGGVISELSGAEKDIFISNITRYFSVNRGN